MPYIVPQYQNPNQEFARDLLKQALLVAITKGASLPFQGLGQVAKAGQYTSPTGASTMFSPAERVASNPSMSAAQMVSQNAPPGASFTPTQFGIGQVPNLDRQVQQADIAYKKAQTASMNPEYQANVWRQALGIPPTGLGQGSANPNGDTITSAAHSLYQSANDPNNPNKDKDKQKLLMIMNLLEAK